LHFTALLELMGHPLGWAWVI